MSPASTTAPYGASSLLYPAEWQAVADIFGSTGAGLLFLRNGLISRVNRRVLEQLGFGEAELVGQPVEALFPPDNSNPLADEQCCGRNGHAVRGTNIRLADKGGGLIDFHLIVNRIDTLSDTHCAIWVLQPIAAQPAAGNPCRNAQYFQAITENSPELLYVCQPDSRLAYASPSFGRILGHDPRQLTGSRLADLVHQEDRPRLLAALTQLAQRDAAEMPAYRLRHRDGSWRHICGQGRNLLAEPAVGGLLLTGWDATEQQLQQQRIAAEKKRQLHYLNRLFQFAQHPQQNIMQALKVIVKASAKALGTQRCAYWEVDDDPAATRCVAMYDDMKQNFVSETPQPAFATTFHPLLQQVLRNEQSMVVSDVDQDPRVAVFCEYFHAALIKSAILVPVRRLGQAAGVLMLATLRRARAWTNDEAAFAGNVADCIALAFEEAERARSDGAGGAQERDLLPEQPDEVFRRLAASGSPFAAFFITLDDFERARHALGPVRRDALLNAVALRLKNMVRKDDVLVRLSGNAFMLLSRNLTDVRIADDIGLQIAESMRNVFVLQGHTLQLCATVGNAFYPADGMDIATLMQKAALAPISAVPA